MACSSFSRIRFVKHLTLSILGGGVGLGLWYFQQSQRSSATEDSNQATLGSIAVGFGATSPAPPSVAEQTIRVSPVHAPSDSLPAAQILSPQQESQPAPEAPGINWNEKLLGTWEFNDSIERVIENRLGGDATMNVKLDFLSALRYGQQLTLTLRWEVTEEDGKPFLTHQIISGTPELNVKNLIQDWGNERKYEIVSLNESELLLKTVKHNKEEVWIRVSGVDIATDKQVPVGR